MKFVVDCKLTSDGHIAHWETFDTEDMVFTGTVDKDGNKETISGVKLLEQMRDSEDVRKKALADRLTNLHGHPEGTTVWDVIKNQARYSTADAEVKALAL